MNKTPTKVFGGLSRQLRTMTAHAKSRRASRPSVVARVQLATQTLEEKTGTIDRLHLKVALATLNEYLLADGPSHLSRFEMAADRAIDLRLTDYEQLLVIAIEDGLDIAYEALEASTWELYCIDSRKRSSLTTAG